MSPRGEGPSFGAQCKGYQSPFSLISQVLASAHNNLHGQQSFGKQAAGLPAEDNRGEQI